jgi:hypothetical protein
VSAPILKKTAWEVGLQNNIRIHWSIAQMPAQAEDLPFVVEFVGGYMAEKPHGPYPHVFSVAFKFEDFGIFLGNYFDELPHQIIHFGI